MFVGDERLHIKIPFNSLNRAEAAKNRTELARNLLDALYAKEEQATCSISGKVAGKGNLDPHKMEALKSKLLAFCIGACTVLYLHGLFQVIAC